MASDNTLSPVEEIKLWKAIEIESRKSIGEDGDALHPDMCMKLNIAGINWSVPSRGAKIKPSFKDGKVTVEISGGDEWDDADEILEIIQAHKDDEICEKCGQPLRSTLEIDLDADNKIIELVLSLTSKLLLKQYNLTDDQLSNLLSCDCFNMPAWIMQILKWAIGDAFYNSIDDMIADDVVDNVAGSVGINL